MIAMTALQRRRRGFARIWWIASWFLIAVAFDAAGTRLDEMLGLHILAGYLVGGWVGATLFWRVGRWWAS